MIQWEDSIRLCRDKLRAIEDGATGSILPEFAEDRFDSHPDLDLVNITDHLRCQTGSFIQFDDGNCVRGEELELI